MQKNVFDSIISHRFPKEAKTLKKALCLLLALTLTVIFTFASFAAIEDITDDATAPGSALTSTGDMYDEDPPYSPPDGGEEEGEVEIQDLALPASGELEKTGGFPAFVFYIAGGICILAAIFIATRKTSKAG